MYIVCTLYRWSGKGLRVSIGLQNKRLALKSRKPPPRSGQSSLALEYSLTHLALACLSIRYVMYPRSTLTPYPVLLLLVPPTSLVASLSVRIPRHVTIPGQVRKIKERPFRPNLHSYRTCVYVLAKIRYPIESYSPGFSTDVLSMCICKLSYVRLILIVMINDICTYI